MSKFKSKMAFLSFIGARRAFITYLLLSVVLNIIGAVTNYMSDFGYFIYTIFFMINFTIPLTMSIMYEGDRYKVISSVPYRIADLPKDIISMNEMIISANFLVTVIANLVTRDYSATVVSLCVYVICILASHFSVLLMAKEEMNVDKTDVKLTVLAFCIIFCAILFTVITTIIISDNLNKTVLIILGIIAVVVEAVNIATRNIFIKAIGRKIRYVTE